MILRPVSPKTETIAVIKANGNGITIKFPEKRDDFREIVKLKLGYTWQYPLWVRDLIPVNGTVEDRLIELSNKLLLAGFVIDCPDSLSTEAIACGNYTPEQTKWITAYTDGNYKGWFCIRWGRNDDYYHAARAIAGSKYNPPRVAVPPEQYEEVLGFAEVHGFSVSDYAARIVEEAATKKRSALILTVAPHTPSPRPQQPSAVVIPDDLLDN